MSTPIVEVEVGRLCAMKQQLLPGPRLIWEITRVKNDVVRIVREEGGKSYPHQIRVSAFVRDFVYV